MMPLIRPAIAVQFDTIGRIIPLKRTVLSFDLLPLAALFLHFEYRQSSIYLVNTTISIRQP